jgi:anti-sigma-K factor RskA
VEPSERVWRTIRAAIAPRAPGTPSFWKSFGLVAGGMASVFVAFFLWTAVAPTPEPVFVSMLMGPDNTARMEVSMYKPDVVRVKMMKPWKDMPGKGLELWVLPREGKPRSIGMVKNDMSETVIRIAENDPRVEGARGLAISMEPMTGSPTGQPTGPVLCSGTIAAVRQT